MRYVWGLLLITGLSFSLQAQHLAEWCGTDAYSHELYQQYPELREAMLQNRAYLKSFTENYVQDATLRGGNDSVYTIPVVFHVIHTYGNENISNDQLMSGLQVLNRNFANQHPDANNIKTEFKPIAANCEIEFKLAQKDPQGNCHSGINRIASPLTNTGYHSVKNLAHWDPTRYLNIYVVKNIPNLAGHCLMPDQAATKPEWDGIVMAHTYMGNIGTSNEQRSVVMAHEAGHYLNLFHIWGGNNVPDYFYQPVGQAGNCQIGDDVPDTPPTIGWQLCDTNAASCGNVVDNVQNVMDYSYCNFMFTQGQRMRMRAALNAPIAGRNNLVTTSNLQSTGVGLDVLCKAGFKASTRTACVLDTIRFTDESQSTPDSWLWNFGDGETSTAQNPTHVYYVPGDYYVTLTASKNGSSITSAPLWIRVNFENPVPYFVQDFENVSNFDNSGLLHETDNPNIQFKISDNGQGYLLTKAGVARFADTIRYTGRSNLISMSADITGVNNPVLSFRYAFSQKLLNTDDQLEVFTSNNCGKTWQSRGKRNGVNLRTTSVAVNDTTWQPTDTLEWKQFSVVIPANHAVKNFQFKIEFTNYYGNNLYLDDININAAAFTDIEKLAIENLRVTPNPAQHQIQLQGDFDEADAYVLDVYGRLVKQVSNVTSSSAISTEGMPNGMYIVRLENAHLKGSARFIVQQ